MRYYELSNEAKIAANQLIEEKEFWLNELRGNFEITNFPYDFNTNDYSKASYCFTIDEDVFYWLTKVSNGSDSNIHMILVAAVSLLLQKYNRKKEFIIGTTIDKQDLDVEYTNTILPLKISLPRELTFKEFLLTIRNTINNAIENQNYPIIHLVNNELNVSNHNHFFSLFDVAVLLENIQEKKYIDPININTIFLFNREKDNLSCTIEYNAGKYSKDTIKRISNHLNQLLKNISGDISNNLASIELLSDNEKEYFINEFNNNKIEVDHTKPIYSFIDENVYKKPDDLAIWSKNKSICYQELAEKSNQYAQYLLGECALKEGEIVAVMMDRSIEMLSLILGIWKVHGVYLPLESSIPFSRQTKIINDARAKVIVSGSNNIKRLLELQHECSELEIITCIDTNKVQEEIEQVVTENSHFKDILRNNRKLHHDNSNIEKYSKEKPNLPENNLKERLVYALYTSGSTGVPKGVLIEHAGMLNHIFAKINDLNITGKTKLAQNSSASFDISIWQFFTALVKGGTTIIISDQDYWDFESFTNHILDNNVTVCEVVPSYLAGLLDYLDKCNVTFPCLEYFIVTGEELKPSLAQRWFGKFPGIKLVNAYGPTEASDDITHGIFDNQTQLERIPIGKSVANLNIYIINEQIQFCPVGGMGEIVVSGIGVGRGYLNDVEKTNNSFMPDPFVKKEKLKLYKTGDVGSWRADGNIDFYGRKDSQVKIHGFRIELGEIERVLMQHKTIQDAIVVDKKKEDGETILCAYIIANKHHLPAQLKEYLSSYLPYYMIPLYFIELNEFPRSASGKVDRKELQERALVQDEHIKYISNEQFEELCMLLKQDTKNEITGEKEEENEAYHIEKEERHKLVYEFNNTAVTYNRQMLIHEYLEHKAKEIPDSIALIFNNEHITYHELNVKANQLANLLIENGITKNKVVGIIFERSIEMMIALFATLKAGAAYLPVGNENPKERMVYMLEDSHVEIVLTNMDDVGLDENYKIFNLGDINFNEYNGSNPEVPTNSFQRAYIMYTSGSTGNPKGVMITHCNVINFIKGMDAFFEISIKDSVLSLITISFDIFILEMLFPIANGAKVVIGDPRSQALGEETYQHFQKYCITMFQCTPYMIQELVAHEKVSEYFKTLKYLLIGGEILHGALLDKVKTYLNTRIFNMYGPTETTVWSTVKEVSGEMSLNIGKPIANTQIYILDSKNNICPIGVNGELCIGGDGVAEGYMNKEALTEKKFIADPFIEGNKIYKTGDIARWMPDGNIDFIGRNDNQIKIRGLRIELTEIENSLLKMRDIKEAIVIAKDTIDGNTELCAFLVSGKNLERNPIITFLMNELPQYMFPDRFIQLEKLPLTVNNKVNRKLLKDLYLHFDEDYSPPKNEIETKLTKIWNDILGGDKISVKQNFYSIGGDSIKSISLISAVRREFNVRLKVPDIFQNETIEKLAVFVDNNLEETVQEETAEVTAELEDIKNKFISSITQ